MPLPAPTSASLVKTRLGWYDGNGKPAEGQWWENYEIAKNILVKERELKKGAGVGQRSSGVEQRFRKPLVVGSNPTAGSMGDR